MKQGGNFIRGTIKYQSIVWFVVSILVCLGVFGLLHINKDEFPTFEIKEGLVAGVYPGATAEEVEEQLTKPLEEILFSFPEVARSTYSYSHDGICYIYVMLDVPPDKKDATWSKIKLRLESQKKFLPPGVLAVEVLDDFSSISSVLVAMESTDKGPGEMKEYSDKLCRMLREIPSLANVSVFGTRQEEIAVTADMERISAYGINPTMLMLDYKSSSIPLTGGTFKTSYTESPIHIHGDMSSEMAVAEKIIWSDYQGGILRLKDIAKIERRYKDPSSFVEFNGNSALIISVEMRPDNNIVDFGNEVDRVIGKFSEDLPDSVTLTKITDQPKVVGKSVWSFLRDLVISILVVILVMLMLFPARSAVIASSGVPICTAVAIAVMYLVGMSLDTVTLAGLIVVLGMIVDDSIITMDGYMDKLRQGMGRMDAACASAKELIMPMVLATSSISLMFFPMLGTITGYLGDFVKAFPWVVSIALFSSLLYAIFVVPSLEVRFIGPAASAKKTAFGRVQEKFFNLLQRGYEKLQALCFRHPYMTVLAGVAAIGLGVLMFSRLNIQMMPMAVRDCFAVEIYLGPNATLQDTKQVSDSLQKVLLADSRVTSVTAFVGTGSPRFHATYAPKVPSPGFAQFIVNTTGSREAEEVINEYEKKYEYYFPDALVRFKQMDYQGVTASVGVTFSGSDIETMRPWADSLKAYMTGMDDLLKWVHCDSDDFLSAVSVDVDSDEAARLGVNNALLALSLSGNFGGRSLTTLWEDGEKIAVNLYADGIGEDMSYETVGNKMVPTSFPGVSVPLRQVAEVNPQWHPEAIPHIGGKQALTVYADMRYGCSQPVAMKRIDKFLKSEIKPALPEGVKISYGGLSSTNEEVGPEIFLTLICAVSVLFFFLLIHFKKISLALLTLVLSLLCLFGAAFGLWVFNLDFGMTSVLGLVSLIGIVVRNGILMFEYAEELRYGQGFSVHDAAMEAGRRRMRPIFLTSCTTALGVLPMIISGDALWMPMGLVICFGTLLSIVFIVEIMPVCYWLIFRRADRKGVRAVAADGNGGSVLAASGAEPEEKADSRNNAIRENAE